MKYENIIKINLNLKAFSQNIILKIKDETHVGNLDECKSVRTHWIAFPVTVEYITYFNNFGLEYIPKEIKKSLATKTLQ